MHKSFSCVKMTQVNVDEIDTLSGFGHHDYLNFVNEPN